MSDMPSQGQDQGNQNGKTVKPNSKEQWFEPSPASQIKSVLEQYPGEQWGWVIYRCCYKPELEETWQDFKRAVVELETWRVAKSDTPEILERMDWVFIEDPTLEGASQRDLKPRFRSWVMHDSDYTSTRPNLYCRGSRYSFFIYVDEEALQSLHGYGRMTPLQLLGLGRSPTRHVKMVRAWYDTLEPDPTELQDPDYDEEFEEWMKICPRLLTSWCYIEFEEDDEVWYVRFISPPEIRHR